MKRSEKDRWARACSVTWFDGVLCSDHSSFAYVFTACVEALPQGLGDGAPMTLQRASSELAPVGFTVMMACWLKVLAQQVDFVRVQCPAPCAIRKRTRVGPLKRISAVLDDVVQCSLVCFFLLLVSCGDARYSVRTQSENSSC